MNGNQLNDPADAAPADGTGMALPGNAYDTVLLEWRTRLLRVLLNGALIIGLPAIILAALDVISKGQVVLAFIYLAVYLVAVWLRFGKAAYRLRAWIFVLLPFALGVSTLLETGIASDTRIYFILFPIVTLMLLGSRAGWAAFGLELFATTIVGYLTVTGLFIPMNGRPMLEPAEWIRITLVLVLGIVVIMFGIILLEGFTRQTLEREDQAKRQLINEQRSLEMRVAERTRALQASFQVSQHLSSLSDPDELVQLIVEEVQRAFGYYHVHVYIFNEEHNFLVLAGGTGEAGQILLSRKHKIQRGRGLVGRAGDMNRPVLVPDTLSDPAWLPNPLLPDTRSEMAVPVSMGDSVIGVLDVQHNVVNGLSESDVDLMLSIANQLAVAFQGSRQAAQARRQAEREAQAGRIAMHLQTAASVEDVLEIAVRELGSALGAERARIELNMQDSTARQR